VDKDFKAAMFKYIGNSFVYFQRYFKNVPFNKINAHFAKQQCLFQTSSRFLSEPFYMLPKIQQKHVHLFLKSIDIKMNGRSE